MNQPGLFDYSNRLARIDNVNDPFAELNRAIDWEQFRELIKLPREKPRKSPAGAKGYDSILMFKILNIEASHNLSDKRLEGAWLDLLLLHKNR